MLVGGARWLRRSHAKKPTRGSGISVTLPTEPLAGAAKTAAIMAVMVQDDGVSTPGIRNQEKGSQSRSE